MSEETAPAVHNGLSHSAGIKNIAAALAKAQSQFQAAVKGNINPHFRSRYADLATMIEATRAALTAEGIAVVQSPWLDGMTLRMHTQLFHASGEWIAGTMACALKATDPQTIGSGTTYLRRYHFAAMVGIAPEDDDGEGAMHRGGTTAEKPAPITEEQAADLQTLLENTQTDVTKFCEFFHIQSIKEMPSADYARAVTALQAKKKNQR